MRPDPEGVAKARAALDVDHAVTEGARHGFSRSSSSSSRVDDKDEGRVLRLREVGLSEAPRTNEDKGEG